RPRMWTNATTMGAISSKLAGMGLLRGAGAHDRRGRGRGPDAEIALSTPGLSWPGPLQQRRDRRRGPVVGVGAAEEALAGVMGQVDAAELPDELLDVEVGPQMPQFDGLAGEALQQAPPLRLHGSDLVADGAFDVVELEHRGRHRASARQARPGCPAEPVADQGLEAREAFRFGHRRLDDPRGEDAGHLIEQADLHLVLGAE